MVVDLGSEQFEERKLIALEESFAEDIRLSYVAMTRAKLRCYIAWANVRTKENRNHSALSRLLFNPSVKQSELGDDFSRQQIDLRGLIDRHQGFFEYHSLPSDQAIRHLREFKNLTPLKAPEQCSRNLKTMWQINSYTGLSALSLGVANEGLYEHAEETSKDNLLASSFDPLPRGRRMGNLVHELLEKNTFAELAKHYVSTTKIEQACIRFGVSLDDPQLMSALLREVVITPLDKQDDGFKLAQIDAKHCLKEMPFYLSHGSINTEQINTILGDEVIYSALSTKKLAGFLTGFIDLVCVYQGKYYLMDYKSNYLDDYSSASMIQAMRAHNYGLQAWIYSVVLTNFLQETIVDYSFDRHFGGVLYLFVRGMKSDEPCSGVFSFLPHAEKLEQLSRLFSDE